MKTARISSALRGFLALGRVPSLPTVWSNCLAAWWLGGGRNTRGLPLLIAGASFAYLGGSFLNDVFDAAYDRQYRRTRPIPAGSVSAEAVLRWALVFLAAAILAFFCANHLSGILCLALIVCTLVYNTIHRWLTFSPALLGLARLLLYAAVAAAAPQGITGWSIWCGLAMAAYVAGTQGIACWENDPEPPSLLCLLPLSIPVILALLMNPGPYREGSLLLIAISALWTIRCLRPTFGSAPRPIGRATEGLLAGIALVDWVAAADAGRDASFAFIALFLATILLQRVSRAL